MYYNDNLLITGKSKCQNGYDSRQ